MAMALGEAFVNVRADLTPFAKDLERDLKKILAAADAKIKAQSKFGRGVGDSLRDNTSRGLSDGIEDGWQKGTRRGVKKGVSESAKFFAALGDFLDDGLSAIPAEVKAAIVIGLVGAAAVVAPLLAGVISAGIITGGIAGAAILGTVLASRFKAVSDQFQGLLQSILARLAGPASRFIDPLVRAAESIDNLFARIAPNLDHIFDQVAGAIGPVTDALIDFVERVTKGFQALIRNARPIIDALVQSLPELGDDIAIFFAIIASDSADAGLALRDFIDILGILIIDLGAFIRVLTETYFWLRVTAKAMTGDFNGAAILFQQRNIESQHAAEGFSSGLQNNLNPALSATAAEAKATALAIRPLITNLTRGFDASIDLAQAQADLAKSMKEGNKDFRLSSQNGRDNLRLVKAEVDALAAKRDEDIRVAIQHGQSTDQIEADYQRQVDAAERSIAKTGNETQALKDLFSEARNAPKEVEVAVQTPGLDAAIASFKLLGQAAAHAAAVAAASIITAGGGHGLRTGVQYALGGIVSSPTLGLVGEAGYKEAVIPDPAVMPARAMQLSDQIGLTSMIADSLGARQSVVNVYIGSQRLQEMIDYTVAMNNQMTTRSFAQGPRR